MDLRKLRRVMMSPRSVGGEHGEWRGITILVYGWMRLPDKLTKEVGLRFIRLFWAKDCEFFDVLTTGGEYALGIRLSVKRAYPDHARNLVRELAPILRILVRHGCKPKVSHGAFRPSRWAVDAKG